MDIQLVMSTVLMSSISYAFKVGFPWYSSSKAAVRIGCSATNDLNDTPFWSTLQFFNLSHKRVHTKFFPDCELSPTSMCVFMLFNDDDIRWSTIPEITCISSIATCTIHYQGTQCLILCVFVYYNEIERVWPVCVGQIQASCIAHSSSTCIQ